MSESNVSDPAATDVVRVLLIDDSKSARRVTTSQLTEAGFTVINANDGFAALADVVEHRPHVIVADIVMPRLDGYQTCALIKHNPDYRSIPIVLVSSRDGLFDRARGRLVGADAHLAKPYSEEELISTIRDCLTASSRSEPELAHHQAEPTPSASASGGARAVRTGHEAVSAEAESATSEEVVLPS